MYLRLVLIFFLFFVRSHTASAQTNPPDEITLEANIVQIILNDEHRNGVDWGAIVTDYHTVPLKKEDDPLWNDYRSRLSFGTVSQDDYAVLLDALDMAGQMSQSQQPPVKITAHVPASISFDKQNIHVDLLLTRLKTGELSLGIDPHMAAQYHARTKILVANDMTVVIGGIMREEEIRRTRKFPLLGDIPIVGLVFRSHGRLMQKTETVIFLTVRAQAVETSGDDKSL